MGNKRVGQSGRGTRGRRSKSGGGSSSGDVRGEARKEASLASSA